MNAPLENERQPGSGGSRHGRPPAGGGGLLARCAGLVIVAMAALWLALVGPIAMDIDRGDLGEVGDGLRRGESFGPETLRAVAQNAQHLLQADLCVPRDAVHLALVYVAQVTEAFGANDPDAADHALTGAADAAKRTLFCSPNSSLAWIILAWTEFMRNDFTPQFQSLIRMSEQVGPREGWAVIHRVELMLHLLPQLSEADLNSLKEQIQSILSGGGYDFLAVVYTTGDADLQKYLRSVFTDAGEKDQRWIAALIRERGGDIDLPFVTPRGARPWDK